MIVFVAGLSKSGKSTRSHHAAARLDDLEYVSVSKLLARSGGVLPVRTFTDALLNQRLATDLLSRGAAVRRHQLIDGHALIETSEGPMPVPDSFFEIVRPDLILYVHDEPDELRMRRVPHGMAQSARELAALMTMEQAVCERIAVRLGIPLDVLFGQTGDAFTAALKVWLDAAQ